MQVLTGTVKNGMIEINQPVPAMDGTSVVIFIMPKVVEANSTESLFGKWDWYTEETEKEIHHAWQKWTQKTSAL
jgi:hypothetical protein